VFYGDNLRNTRRSANIGNNGLPRNLREGGPGYGKSRSSAANDDPLLKVLLDIKDNSNFKMEQLSAGKVEESKK